jgi:hypothetical protein
LTTRRRYLLKQVRAHLSITLFSTQLVEEELSEGSRRMPILPSLWCLHTTQHSTPILRHRLQLFFGKVLEEELVHSGEVGGVSLAKAIETGLRQDMESACQAGAKTAGWDLGAFQTNSVY